MQNQIGGDSKRTSTIVDYIIHDVSSQRTLGSARAVLWALNTEQHDHIYANDMQQTTLDPSVRWDDTGSVAHFVNINSSLGAHRTSYKNRMRHQDGFTYLGLLILIAIIGIASAASLQVGSILERRAAEEELLEVGSAYRDALISYSATTPEGQATLPHSLQDLLTDPRYSNPIRHLRKMYADPITGKEEWGTITMPSVGGPGIIGVYSLSDAIPIKVGNFDARFQDFQGKSSYRGWKFLAVPEPELAAPATAVPETAPKAPIQKKK